MVCNGPRGSSAAENRLVDLIVPTRRSLRIAYPPHLGLSIEGAASRNEHGIAGNGIAGP